LDIEVPTDPEFIVVALPSTVCVEMLVLTEPILTVVAVPVPGATADSEAAEP
jgi:hypothetical protein